MLRKLAFLLAFSLPAADDGWTPLFNGKNLDGWTPNENTASWKVADGLLAGDGPRSHLFYTGKVRNASFRNFELKAEVMTRPGANSGIYFHTRFQKEGWLDHGMEVQINNTAAGERGYIERKKTGSLYGVRNVYKQLVKDGEWFELHIVVRGKQVQTRLNGVLLVDYIEPDPPVRLEGRSGGRVLGEGTFALQCHDAGSKVFFRNIRVRPLPDSAQPDSAERPTVDAVYRALLRLSAANYPVVDFHVHLKSGWSLEEALRNSRRHGIGYGIAVNCGLGFPITDDEGAEQFLRSMQGQPVFVAMQAESREWVHMFSKQTREKFDYVFTDSMTFSDDQGKRMRLWIKKEVGEIADQQAFMDLIVNRTVGILRNEPIDVYVNPTFLPEPMAPHYDQLWTAERMKRVIDAARERNIAIEINNRYRIPSAAFIKQAKAAGVKFTCGTNNSSGADIGRMEYCLEMIRECGLRWQEMWVPEMRTPR